MITYTIWVWPKGQGLMNVVKIVLRPMIWLSLYVMIQNYSLYSPGNFLTNFLLLQSFVCLTSTKYKLEKDRVYCEALPSAKKFMADDHFHNLSVTKGQGLVNVAKIVW